MGNALSGCAALTRVICRGILARHQTHTEEGPRTPLPLLLPQPEVKQYYMLLAVDSRPAPS